MSEQKTTRLVTVIRRDGRRRCVVVGETKTTIHIMVDGTRTIFSKQSGRARGTSIFYPLSYVE